MSLSPEHDKEVKSVGPGGCLLGRSTALTSGRSCHMTAQSGEPENGRGPNLSESEELS